MDENEAEEPKTKRVKVWFSVRVDDYIFVEVPDGLDVMNAPDETFHTSQAGEDMLRAVGDRIADWTDVEIEDVEEPPRCGWEELERRRAERDREDG